VTSHEKEVVALLRRMEALQPDDLTIYNVDCGIHSGFPACCIVFFVKVWDRWVLSLASLHAHGETHAQLLQRADSQQKEALLATDSYRDMIGDLHVGYVPCPRCLLDRSFVVPRKCSVHLNCRARDRVRRLLA